MAATVEASRLTEAHRLAQLRLGANTVAALLGIWPLLELSDLDATVQRWLRAALAIIASDRVISARLGANYLSTFRTLELGVDAGRFTPTLAEELDRKAAITSLLVTGPYSLRAALAKGVPFDRANETAQARAAAAGMRHALNGSRATILGSLTRDRNAIGWARATSGKACAFCLSKAGRRMSSDAVFQAHDHCACTAEPVYRRDAAFPAA